MKDLSECRAEIDAIDKQLLELLEARIRVAENVAKYKLANNMKVFDESRERAVLDKIGERSPTDVRAELVGTYDGIMNMSKLHQYQLKSEFSEKRSIFGEALERGSKLSNDYCGKKVGAQGVDGAFSAKASRKRNPTL